MARTPIYVVDAFASKPFGGNSAAVCLLPRPATGGWMQQVARELNLPMTAYVVPTEGGFRLRWFNAMAEVDLCGHATLAAAHVVWDEGLLKPRESARFFTRSGTVSASRRRGEIELDFPAEPAKRVSVAGIRRIVGAPTVFVGKNRFDLVVEVSSETELHQLRPDLGRLAALPVRALIVTCAASGPRYDFLVRFFSPRLGIPEDPVSGSAFCALTPYWSGRFQRPELRAYQASIRGGEVHTRMLGSRVGIAGKAVTVLRGRLAV